MNDEHLTRDIQRSVLERLHREHVTMRSRAYFWGRIVLAALLCVLALALSAFVLSFIAFSVHESGELFLLGFGARGVQTFFLLFPWLALAFDVAVLFVLEWLLQGFRFGYRVSLLNLFVVVMLVSGVLAFLVAATPLHRSLLEQADRGELPLMGELYESIRASHVSQGIFRGTVRSVQGATVTIEHSDLDHDADDGTRIVTLPSGALVPQVGERVYIFGSSTAERVDAYGIGRLSPGQ